TTMCRDRCSPKHCADRPSASMPLPACRTIRSPAARLCASRSARWVRCTTRCETGWDSESSSLCRATRWCLATSVDLARFGNCCCETLIARCQPSSTGTRIRSGCRAPPLRQHLGKIEPTRCKARIPFQTGAQCLLRCEPLTGVVAIVGQGEPGQSALPVLTGRLVCTLRGIHPAGLFQVARRRQPDGFLRGSGKMIGLEGQYRPAITFHPATLELTKAAHPAPGSAGAKNDLLLGEVVTDHHSEMPLRPAIERQVLQHQYRIARRHFRQQRFQLRLQWIDEQTMRASGGHHLYLQTSFTFGKIDTLHQLLGGGIDAALVQHGRQCSRATLVILLGKERYLGELYPLGQLRTVIYRYDRRTCTGPKQAEQQQYQKPRVQRLMQLMKLKMLVAQSMSVMMKITRNKTMMPTTPAPAGAWSSCWLNCANSAGVRLLMRCST